MERFLTAFVLGLCTAPGLFVLTLQLIDHSNRVDPSQRPNLTDSLLLGVGIAVVGFILIGGLAWFLAANGYLRPVQVVTALMLAGWSLAGAVFAWKEPRTLDYRKQRAVLQTEIRVAKSLLDNQPLTQAVVPSFTGGCVEHCDVRRVRDEGNFLVMPWETTVTIVYSWSIWITLPQAKHLYFPMKLPYRPTQSTDWSAWETPAPHKHSITPTGLTLRYRFRLVPQSVEHP